MLKGKVAAVTGGSRGIGRAIVLKMAEYGADVAVIYAGNQQAAEQTCAEAAQLGVKAKAYQCDVSLFDAVKSTMNTIIKEFNGIDILVNNAGITRDGLIATMKESEYDVVLDTNLKGVFNTIKHCTLNFIKKKGGRIINIGSIAGISGNPGQANYAAAKAGMIGLTKTVAREMASRNICCNVIAPGFIETELTHELPGLAQMIEGIPFKRMGKPDDVAELAAFLASDKANYITGEVIRVDGGLSI